jgi:DNA invertase Pin-like site-specific DNA recombinase
MNYRLGYARVSTHAQDPQLQLDALNAAGVDRLYVDHISGVATRRPELDRLLDNARPGDTIVIWRLDRLGRSMKHLLDLIEDLERRNIALVSLNEQIDTTSANGRLILRLLAALAAFERDLLAERTKAGLGAARKQGRVVADHEPSPPPAPPQPPGCTAKNRASPTSPPRCACHEPRSTATSPP